MNFDLKKSLQATITMRQDWLATAFENKARLQPFLKPIKALLLLLPESASVGFWSEKIEITLKVTDMDTVKPYLEAFELITGAEFDGSVDETTYTKSRTFSMSKFPLKIIADVSDNDESASCKAVRVGETVVPVYELRCDDTEQKPTQPADDIPF